MFTVGILSDALSSRILREFCIKITPIIYVLLVLALVLLPAAALANEECGVNTEGEFYGKGDINGQAQFSNRKLSLTKYGYGFWVENIGVYANGRGTNTAIGPWRAVV